MAKHKWHDVIVAYAEGEEIQFFNKRTFRWEDAPFRWEDAPVPTFYPEYEWRVKPKSPMYRLFIYNGGEEVFVVVKNYSDVETETLRVIKAAKDVVWLTDWLPLEKKDV